MGLLRLVRLVERRTGARLAKLGFVLCRDRRRQAAVFVAPRLRPLVLRLAVTLLRLPMALLRLAMALLLLGTALPL